LTKKIKELETEMQERHTKELADFDALQDSEVMEAAPEVRKRKPNKQRMKRLLSTAERITAELEGRVR